jgi:hypothetical protein
LFNGPVKERLDPGVWGQYHHIQEVPMLERPGIDGQGNRRQASEFAQPSTLDDICPVFQGFSGVISGQSAIADDRSRILGFRALQEKRLEDALKCRGLDNRKRGACNRNKSADFQLEPGLLVEPVPFGEGELPLRWGRRCRGLERATMGVGCALEPSRDGALAAGGIECRASHHSL